MHLVLEWMELVWVSVFALSSRMLPSLFPAIDPCILSDMIFAIAEANWDLKMCLLLLHPSQGMFCHWQKSPCLQ